MHSLTLKSFCMQSKNRQNLFTMQLLLLVLICHIGSYFLPTTNTIAMVSCLEYPCGMNIP